MLTLIVHIFKGNIILKLNKFNFLILLFLIQSCSFLGPSKDEHKSKGLKINFHNEKWTSISKDQSDYAFKNKLTLSYIIINSFCRKYMTNSLKELSLSLLSSIEALKINSQVSSYHQKRESLSISAEGKVDGHITYIELISLKKNRCIYDFMLISKNALLLSKDSQILEQILESSVIQ